MNCFDANAPNECICFPEGEGCFCCDNERALRAYAYGSRQPMPPMTGEQREACLDEIGNVEGYRREDYAQSPDKELAHGVLCAWMDYCRDKGLL